MHVINVNVDAFVMIRRHRHEQNTQHTELLNGGFSADVKSGSGLSDLKPNDVTTTDNIVAFIIIRAVTKRSTILYFYRDSCIVNGASFRGRSTTWRLFVIFARTLFSGL